MRGALTSFWKHEFANHRINYRNYSQGRVVAICAVGIRQQGDAEDMYRQLQAIAKTGRPAEQIAEVLKKILPEK